MKQENQESKETSKVLISSFNLRDSKSNLEGRSEQGLREAGIEGSQGGFNFDFHLTPIIFL